MNKIYILLYNNNMKVKKIIKAIFVIFIPLIGGFLFSLLTNFKNYKVLNKPPISPPGLVFPIAWSILYLLLGVSLYISTKKSKEKSIIISYIINLLLNYTWSIVFFKFKLYKVAIFHLLALIISTIYLMKKLYKKNKLTAYLQLPYLFWLLFALYLNVGVSILN